jgi:hypothetical protein
MATRRRPSRGAVASELRHIKRLVQTGACREANARLLELRLRGGISRAYGPLQRRIDRCYR